MATIRGGVLLLIGTFTLDYPTRTTRREGGGRFEIELIMLSVHD